MPNNRNMENSYQKHNDITTSKYVASKNYIFSRPYILGTYNPNLIELILKPVLMYLNIFSYWRYL